MENLPSASNNTIPTPKEAQMFLEGYKIPIEDNDPVATAMSYDLGNPAALDQHTASNSAASNEGESAIELVERTVREHRPYF